MCAASHTTWDETMDNAIGLILDLNLSTQVLERFQVTESDLAAIEEAPNTWVGLVVSQLVGDRTPSRGSICLTLTSSIARRQGQLLAA